MTAVALTPGKCRRCDAPISPILTLCQKCFAAVYVDDEPEALPKSTSDLNRLAALVAAGHACPWCRQLVDIDTIPPWWLDHRNLAELYAHMSGSDCPEDDALDPASVQYFLEKPWKWTDEREGDRNWEKGLPLSRYIDSAERHMNAFKDGDRSEDHLAAILWNVAGYMWTERQIEMGALPDSLDDVPWEPSTGKVL